MWVGWTNWFSFLKISFLNFSVCVSNHRCGWSLHRFLSVSLVSHLIFQEVFLVFGSSKSISILFDVLVCVLLDWFIICLTSLQFGRCSSNGSRQSSTLLCDLLSLYEWKEAAKNNNNDNESNNNTWCSSSLFFCHVCATHRECSLTSPSSSLSHNISI